MFEISMETENLLDSKVSGFISRRLIIILWISSKKYVSLQ